MKIVFVSGNLSDGGAQRVIAVVAGRLSEMGHDVSLLLYSRKEKEYPLSPGVRVTALGSSFTEYAKLSGPARIWAIRRFLKAEKPDAAIGFLEGGYGLFLGSLGLGIAKVASARIDPAFLLKKKGLRAWLDRLWFRAADAVVLQTRRQMEHAARTGWKRQTVIPNPVSDSVLAAPAHDYSRPCRRIVMAGRLSPQKNYPLAISAMKEVLAAYPDAVLDIFGKGPEEAALRQRIAEGGLQESIRLHGWTQDVPGEYAKSDVFLLTSDFEGMPNALMEAMAMGLPCISTDCDTGPEDLITDGENGFLAPVKDAAALAKRMKQLLDMAPGTRQQLGEAARRTIAQKCESLAIARCWEQLLLDLTGEKHP